jgi:lipopolysaccharide transport system ATP-binding protein
MSSIAISAREIGKKYQILHRRKSDEDSLIAAFAGGIGRLFSPKPSAEKEEFWALRNISFDIQQGDRVGIIGRNGAGKSTLLKILSRIVSPTTGQIEFEGRLASLLEVGTGFHGDLSGRENIYLNGSILGMRKREIDARFDEIVAFSEVEKFIDTPVKRYSSGMYVRLAFAVAAHLESEILVVDEVLAVGDASFQKKCLGKMREVSETGRTVLFVSHNMAAVQNLCNKAVMLDRGELDYPLSDASECITHYLKTLSSLSSKLIGERHDRSGEGLFRFTDVKLFNDQGNKVVALQSGSDAEMEFQFDLKSESLSHVSIAMTVYAFDGREMFTLANSISGQPFQSLTRGNRIRCRVDKFPLADGEYFCNLIAYSNGIIQDYVQEAFTLQVEAGDFYGTGRTLPFDHNACLLVENEWVLN